MSRLAGVLDREKIKCRISGLFRKKQKKQVTKDERYIGALTEEEIPYGY